MTEAVAKVEELSAVKIPAKLTNHSDHVRWTAFREGGTEMGKWTSTACYSGIMSALDKVEVHCRPYFTRKPGDLKRAALHMTYYKRFFNLCKKAGLVPPEVRVYTEKGENKLHLPRLGWDRHTVYAVLSLYRHADCHPRMVMHAMLLHQKLKEQKIHFLQCLHYALAEFGCPNPGHTFINMNSRGDYEANWGGLNLAAGAALARFANMAIEERRKLEPTGRTLPVMCKLAHELNPIRKPEQAGERSSYMYEAHRTSAKNGIGTPTYVLKSRESILLPKFTFLYDKPDLTPKEFAAAVEEDCKK